MKKVAWLMVALFAQAGLLVSTTVFAGDELGSTEIKQLLSGNTANELNIKHGYQRKIFFDPGGQFRRIDEHGNKTDGTWELEREGVLCMLSRKDRCWKLKKTDKENTYNIHARFGGEHRKVWTIVKGNPNKL